MGWARSAYEDESAERVARLLDERRDATISDTDLDLLMRSIDGEARGWREWWDETDPPKCPPIVSQLIEEARDLLRHGLREEAVARLEKLAFPKWGSEEACRAAYLDHMRAQRAVQSPGATS